MFFAAIVCKDWEIMRELQSKKQNRIGFDVL